MKIVLLGSNGQLGSDIKDSFSNNTDELSIELEPLTRKDFDISDSESMRKTLSELDFDVLINCTGYHKTEEVESNASLGMKINAHAVSEIANICQQNKAIFFHISTDYVFDGSKGSPYTESDTPAPINVYGATKYMGETLAQQECKKTYVLRVASLFGISGSSGKGGNFIENIISQASTEKELNVVNDIYMSPTGTLFIADVIKEMIIKQPTFGIYHVVNDGQASWYEFAEYIINKLNFDAKLIPVSSSIYPSVSKRPKYSVLSPEKLIQIGMHVTSWKEEVDRYLLNRDSSS